MIRSRPGPLRRLAYFCVALGLLGLPSVRPVVAEQDALPIVQRAFEAAVANEAIARQYVYRERIVERRLDRKGREKSRSSRTWDVTLLDGGEQRRLIAVDGRPLREKGARREQRKIEKQIRKLERETPERRRKRLARIERRRQEGEAFLQEITKAFDFRLIGEEQVGDVPAYVVAAEPKPGYRPVSRETRVLPKVRARLWISREDHGWVQAEIEVFEDIRWAIFSKLKAGTRIRFHQRRVNDEVWMTDRWTVRMKARIAFFKFNREYAGSYGNFRRFSTGTTFSFDEPSR